MKYVLVPTDFSEESIKAYKPAAALAKKMGLGIHLYHIMNIHMSELMYWTYGSFGIHPLPVRNEKEELDKHQGTLKEHTLRPEFEGIDIRSSISYSDRNPSSEVIKELNHGDYEIIVMGSSNSPEDENRFATLVARYTTRPLVVIKDQVDEIKAKTVLVCLDMKTDIGNFFQELAKVAPNPEAHYEILYVNTSGNFMSNKSVLKEFERIAVHNGIKDANLTIANEDDVLEGIVEEANKDKYDLVALPTEGQRGWQYLFNGSDAENILHECHKPMYVLNLHEYIEHESSESYKKRHVRNEGTGVRSQPATTGFTGTTNYTV